jgi:hypothetical protein
MLSGKPTVYFNPGKYLVSGTVEIPKSVRRVNFTYCDLISSPELSAMRKTGFFKISEDSDKPLILEDIYTLERFWGYMSFIEHASKRTLIISDVHIQAAPLYFNTVSGGKVFIENSGCTIGGVPGAGARKTKIPWEEKFPYDRETPAFSFIGQEVYARNINPERSLHEVINDGGVLWVLGSKTEEEGTAYETRNGGKSEIYGASLVNGGTKTHPAFINDNSDMSVFSMIFSMRNAYGFPTAVVERQGEEEKVLREDDCPHLFLDSYAIPLYVGRKRCKKS